MGKVLAEDQLPIGRPGGADGVTRLYLEGPAGERQTIRAGGHDAPLGEHVKIGGVVAAEQFDPPRAVRTGQGYLGVRSTEA
jgi:hypothetical protein